jgi:hypothetical protein
MNFEDNQTHDQIAGKDKKFKWTPAYEASFRELKER